mgnify:CR=1 FL=1
MLYMFGDSFSIPESHKTEVFGPDGKSVTYLPLEKSWTTLVNEEFFRDSEIVSDAVLGCSNDYIYQQICIRESSFKTGDYVLVQLTSLHREWFFKDKPYLSNTHNLLGNLDQLDSSITKEQQTALQMYMQYLHSDHRLILHYNAILDSINFRTKLYGEHGIRCLILPGFHNVPGVQGNLSEVSGLEFDCEKTALKYYDKTGDMRFNHFSEVNHKILANKVINFFKTGEIVDLTSGFEKGMYAKEDI